MFVQIAIGSLLMLTTISLTGATLLVVEVLIRRFQPWLTREPHGPKLAIVLIAAALWVMGVVTVDVWTWALNPRSISRSCRSRRSVTAIWCCRRTGGFWAACAAPTAS
jgi:hypothetical protein